MSKSDAVDLLIATETDNAKVENQEIPEEEENKEKVKGKEKETPKDHVKQGRVGHVKSLMTRTQQHQMSLEKQKMVKAQIMRDMAIHLQRPHVRKAYEFFRRKINPKNDLNSEKTREIVKVSADENFLAVTVYRRSPSPTYE